MSLSNLLIGLYFLFVGAALLGIFAVSNTVLGLVAFILGIILLINAFHPININRSNNIV